MAMVAAPRRTRAYSAVVWADWPRLLGGRLGWEARAVPRMWLMRRIGVRSVLSFNMKAPFCWGRGDIKTGFGGG